MQGVPLLKKSQLHHLVPAIISADNVSGTKIMKQGIFMCRIKEFCLVCLKRRFSKVCINYFVMFKLSLAIISPLSEQTLNTHT